MTGGHERIGPIIRRSKLSESDYREIWHYSAYDNPDAAARMLRTIDQRLFLYAANPRMGANRSKLGKGLRSSPVGSYLAFYRVVEGGIELVRVLHGARQLKRSMFK